MDEDGKSPVEHVLDLFVYAPLGLVFERRSVFHQLVERGRAQAGVAKVVGNLALEQGRVEATKVTGRLQEQAEGVLGALGLVPPARPSPGGARGASAASPSDGSPPTDGAVSPPRSRPSDTTKAPPAAESLSIPDYDGLAASQVVNRLAGLTTTELEDVRSYEGAHRRRKTVLNKVEQLLEG